MNCFIQVDDDNVNAMRLECALQFKCLLLSRKNPNQESMCNSSLWLSSWQLHVFTRQLSAYRYPAALPFMGGSPPGVWLGSDWNQGLACSWHCMALEKILKPTAVSVLGLDVGGTGSQCWKGLHCSWHRHHHHKLHLRSCCLMPCHGQLFPWGCCQLHTASPVKWNGDSVQESTHHHLPQSQLRQEPIPQRTSLPSCTACSGRISCTCWTGTLALSSAWDRGLACSRSVRPGIGHRWHWLRALEERS